MSGFILSFSFQHVQIIRHTPLCKIPWGELLTLNLLDARKLQMRHNYYKMEIVAVVTQPLFCVVEILFIWALLAVTVPQDAVNLSLTTQCH